MKTNIKLIVLFFLSTIIISCQKDDFNYPEGSVGSSTITHYINIATIGEQLIIINKGTPYTDQGALSTSAGKAVPYAKSGSVNIALPGIYILNYSATNADGFSSYAYRTVVVMDPAAGVTDLSGSYARSTNSVVSVWDKTEIPGVYTVSNPGGAAGATFSVTVVNYSDNNIVIPQQETSVGTFASSNGLYDPAGFSYSWNIVNGGYGAALRTFNKQ